MTLEHLAQARLDNTWNDEHTLVRSEHRDEVALYLSFLFDEEPVRGLTGAKPREVACEKTVQPRLPIGTSDGDAGEISRLDDERVQLRALDLPFNLDYVDHDGPYTPMNSRWAKFFSSRMRRILSAASSMSYSTRLNSKRFLSLS